MVRVGVVTRLCIGFALLVGISGAACFALVKSKDSTRWVNHTQQVIQEAEVLVSHLKDAETGQRGYLLTNNDRYLEPYELAISQVHQDLQALRQLTRDNPQQQQRLAVLDTLIDRKLAELKRTIDLRRMQGLEAALQVVQTDEGQQTMSQIRAVSVALIQTENVLLQSRTARADSISSWAIGLVIGLSVLAALMLGSAIHLLRRSLSELQQTEAQFRRTVANVPFPLILHAEDGEVRYVNQAWTDITGYRREDIPTIAEWTERAYGDRQALVRTGIDRLYDLDRSVSEGIFAVCTRSGSVRLWDFFSAPLGQIVDGKRLVMSTAIDVTERKAAEDAQRHLQETLEQRVRDRTQQLSEVNQQLKAFTASVSHDLRAPLRGIRGMTALLRQEYGDRLDAPALTYIDHIAQSTARLDRLIQDLLAYSRVSQAEIQLEPVDLEALLHDILRQLEPELQARCAQIQATSPLPIVVGQRSILLQVLTNLLMNALKFVAADVPPQIQVRAEAASDAPNWVRFSIVDNGIGINAQDQQRIFQMFERLNGSDYAGTGIGLAIVQKSIERLGGRVGVRSRLGKGSEFWFELPEEREAAGLES